MLGSLAELNAITRIAGACRQILAGRLHAVHLRHVPVHDHEVGHAREHNRDALAAVCGFADDLMAGVSHQDADEPAGVGVVVDQGNAQGPHRGGRRGRVR